MAASHFRQGPAPGFRPPCTRGSCCAGTVPRYSAILPNECDCLRSEQACPGCEPAQPQPKLIRSPCSSFATPLSTRTPHMTPLHRVMVNQWLIPASPRDRGPRRTAAPKGSAAVISVSAPRRLVWHKLWPGSSAGRRARPSPTNRGAGGYASNDSIVCRRDCRPRHRPVTAANPTRTTG